MLSRTASEGRDLVRLSWWTSASATLSTDAAAAFNGSHPRQSAGLLLDRGVHAAAGVFRARRRGMCPRCGGFCPFVLGRMEG